MDRNSAPATPAIPLPTGGQTTARCRRASMSRLCQQEFYPFALPDQVAHGPGVPPPFIAGRAGPNRNARSPIARFLHVGERQGFDMAGRWQRAIVAEVADQLAG
jgi:hypothetical protein